MKDALLLEGGNTTIFGFAAFDVRKELLGLCTEVIADHTVNVVALVFACLLKFAIPSIVFAVFGTSGLFVGVSKYKVRVPSFSSTPYSLK